MKKWLAPCKNDSTNTRERVVVITIVNGTWGRYSNSPSYLEVVRQCNLVLARAHVAHSSGRVSLQNLSIIYQHGLLIVMVSAAFAMVSSTAVTLLKVNLFRVALGFLVI